MKWFVLIVYLLCYGGYVEMGTLRDQVSTGPDSSVIDEEDIPPSSPLGAECQPGSAWRDGCDQCRCTRAGRRVCSGVICPPDDDPPRARVLCAPNTTWTNPCAECSCSAEGVPGCYLTACTHLLGGVGSGVADEIKDIAPKTIPAKKLNHRDAECLAGTSWRSACHTCTCSERSEAECVNIPDCGDQEGEPIRCKPETTFMRECNWCTCLESGHALCTMMGCEPPKQEPGVVNAENLRNSKPTNLESVVKSRQVKRSTCRPRSSFKRECNICKCASDGLSYHCTDYECVAPASVAADVEVFMHTEDNKSSNKTIVCQANKMFIMDCNTCWCNDDGTSYSCTRRLCLSNPPDDLEIEDVKLEKATSESRPRRDLDSKDHRVAKRVCRPNDPTPIPSDCNTCFCNNDGTGYVCTMMLCLSDPLIRGEVDLQEQSTTSKSRPRRDVNNKEPPKNCLPGQEFRMDCNKCLCDNEGQDFSCTRLDCAAINNHNGGTRRRREVTQQAVSQCVPGSVFDHNCNVCRCTSDGHHATCSLKKCSTNPPEDNGLDPNFRCTPGEQFKPACNDCTCSADGRSVFCTLQLCEEQIVGSV